MSATTSHRTHLPLRFGLAIRPLLESAAQGLHAVARSARDLLYAITKARLLADQGTHTLRRARRL